MAGARESDKEIMIQKIPPFEDYTGVFNRVETWLSKRWWTADYKTLVKRYKGREVARMHQGDIVSHTGLFDAEDEEQAKVEAVEYFGIGNPIFFSLDRRQMEVEHHLLEIQEIVPPTYADESFKEINVFKGHEGTAFSHAIQFKTVYDRVPSGNYGEALNEVKRAMPHFDSPKEDVTYYYRPFYGLAASGEKVATWYVIRHGNPAFERAERLFYWDNMRCSSTDFSCVFRNTYFSDLSAEKQNMARKIKQANWLSKLNQFRKGLDAFNANLPFEKQGYFFEYRPFGELEFVPNEMSSLRNKWLPKEVKIDYQTKKLRDMEWEIRCERESLEKMLHGGMDVA